MKKYLMTAIAAVTLGAAFTSCSHNDDLYNGEENQKQNEQKQIELAQAEYDAVFEATFGKVGANVDWGFSSRAKTRAGSGSIVKPDMTDFPGYSNERCNSANYRTPEGYADVVAPVTTKEAAWVMNWFANNPGLSEEGLDIHNFFVQNVGNNGHTKEGYFHSTEGDKPEEITPQTYEGIYMDKLQIGAVPTEEGTIHGLDFNATNGFNEWTLFYVKDGSALQFGYHASYVSNYEFKFKCVQLTVPGECFEDGKAHVGWYVGLSYYGYKKETDEKYHEIGIDRLQYADDWVLKIVPGASELPYRVIAEDLNAKSASDFDFNDVVFDVMGYDAATNKTTLKLQCAGGIYPIRVGEDDANEIHKLFGVDTKCLVNTGRISGYDYQEKAPVTFTVTGKYTTPEELKGLKIYVQRVGENWTELEATRGRAACKILVDTSFPIIAEKFSIASENENFTKYIAGEFENDFWWQRR